MNLKFLQRMICALLFLPLSSCALLGMIFGADTEGEKKDRFLAVTGHELLKIYSKEEKLGFIYDEDRHGNDAFVKRAWGGKKIIQPTGQSIKLTYSYKEFDQIKLILAEELSVGPELENVHHIVLNLEDVHRYELVDVQPLMELMGKENISLLEKPFVISMLKVTKFSVEAFQKTMGRFGAEYRPYPLIKIKGSTGASSEKSQEQVGYNIFVGYKLYYGSKWIEHFEGMPKIDLWILKPEKDAVIGGERTRITGTILRYPNVLDEYKNRLRLYLMVQDENEDHWVLQPKARIDTEGYFEGIVRLGKSETGDGHRYSIAAFATYFDINREVNSNIPYLPFNKGKYIINVTRRDNLGP
jgi:hypothetical protein